MTSTYDEMIPLNTYTNSLINFIQTLIVTIVCTTMSDLKLDLTNEDIINVNTL